MDDISEDFEELGRGSPCRIKKEPRADGSHLPAMRLEECDVLAGLESRMPVPVQGLWLCRRIRHRGIVFIGYLVLSRLCQIDRLLDT